MHALKWDLWFELLIKFLCLIKTKKSKNILTGVENNFKKKFYGIIGRVL